MEAEVLVVGGGVSGLTTTWQLRRAGVDVVMVEGRDRLGGRVLTEDDPGGACCDLGPSWFWPGQPLIAGVVRLLEIPVFRQFSSGQLVYQAPGGQTVPVSDPSPMLGSLRLQGGMGRLAREVSAQVEDERQLFDHVVTDMSLRDGFVEVGCDTPGGRTTISARRVALAIPPRLAAAISFSPRLPDSLTEVLSATPTWMAGHAKLFAVYDRAFWREKGLAGTAMSGAGPLAEVHDGSSPGGEGACLWGFSGLDAAARAQMGLEGLIDRALSQLSMLFGPDAGSPDRVILQDWSQESLTATDADRVRLGHHPQYGLRPDLGPQWQGLIHFTSSETSYTNGGLLEGALEAARAFTTEFVTFPEDTSGEVTARMASMSWDWF